MSAEATEQKQVAIALFPAEYAAVEMVTDQGEEVLQQEFTDAQLFVHSIQELERVRSERKKTKKRRNETSSESVDTGANVAVGKDEDEPMPMAEDAEVTAESSSSEVRTDGETEETKVKVEVDDAGKDGKASAEEKVAEDDAKHEDEEEEEEEEDVIDPRIHYRPVVAELQATIIELNQLINSIDLIHGRDFLEDMHCRRENVAEKTEDLEFLLASKTQQVKEASLILLTGVDALTSTVEKESNFFDGVTHLLKKWQVCAPMHGTIPKPFRAGEPLAVDCSFVSAGSTFTPLTRTIGELSFAELGRTAKGLVCVKAPDEYLPRTLQVQLDSLESGKSGVFTLPFPSIVSMSKIELDRLENTPEDLEVLDRRNSSLLKAVQFSVFCEELFLSVMREALDSSSSWSDSAISSTKTHTKVPQRGAPWRNHSSTNLVLSEVLDDEIHLLLLDQFELTIRLLDASKGAQHIHPKQGGAHDEDVEMTDANAKASATSNGFHYVDDAHKLDDEEIHLTETSRFVLALLQQEVRCRHGRREIARGLLFSSMESNLASSQAVPPSSHVNKVETIGTLGTVLAVVSHNLMKEQVAHYLDDLSSHLACQKLKVSATRRILDDGLNQPLCDTVEGIYLTPRWKICPYDTTLAAFDLSIGKNFTTEILISGTTIRYEDATGVPREATSLSQLAQFVETTLCSQVAQALYHDLLSFGFHQACIDLDRASVRLTATDVWNGRTVGDGRVPDSKRVPCVFFEPYLATDRTMAIDCALQAVDMSRVAHLTVPHTTAKPSTKTHHLDWERIPGSSDMTKIVWLMEHTTGLSNVLVSN